MNILIPHQWLLDHLETQADPKTIQEKVSLCGPSIERILDIEGDKVYDIEITTNRVDSMSVRGVAREAAVILSYFGIKSKLKTQKIDNENIIKKSELLSSSEKNELPLPKISNDPNLSKRVICVILKDVKRTPTPDWMAQRLIQTQMNVHDSVIDITNYITHELGHPCHAFDYDKLMKTGGQINVVQAQKGETFQTLDSETFKTVGGEVVFKNGQNQIIDLPSIKGTANTSVDQNTTNVLLLLESIKPDKVRFASMTHAIRTTAAQLMEKGVDPHLAKDVLLRGIELYQDLCGAQIASEIYDDFPGQQKMTPVIVEKQTIDSYLGLDLEINKIVDILTQLECKVVIVNQTLTVTPPTFRPDINIPADVVEEIARIYGYHNLPSKVMDTPIPLTEQEGVNFKLENAIKHFLSDIGWQEIYTYSMVSDKLAIQSGLPIDQHLKLSNPLTDDKIFLRRSLIPSLIEAINSNPLEKNIGVFELANVYIPQDNDVPKHQLHLTIVSNKAYRQIIGDFEALLGRLYIDNFTVNQDQAHQAQIMIDQVEIGTIKQLEDNLFAVDVLVDQLNKVAHTHPKYQPIAKTSPIYEDMTFSLPKGAKVGEIIKQMIGLSQLIIDITLTAVYDQNYTFRITYQDLKNNLSATEIEPIRKNLAKMLEDKFSGRLIGEV